MKKNSKAAPRRVARRDLFTELTEGMKLPTFRGQGLRPGVSLDDSAALLELMEGDRDSDRRQGSDLRSPGRRR